MDTVTASLAVAGPADGRHYGKYRGLVTDNQDPRNLGRIRRRCPRSWATWKRAGPCRARPTPATARRLHGARRSARASGSSSRRATCRGRSGPAAGGPAARCRRTRPARPRRRRQDRPHRAGPDAGAGRRRQDHRPERLERQQSSSRSRSSRARSRSRPRRKSSSRRRRSSWCRAPRTRWCSATTC